MRTIRVLGIGVVSGIVLMYLFVSILNGYVRDKWILYTDTQSQCILGWQRDQLMSADENEVFRAIRRSCEALDAQGLNDLIFAPRNSLEVSCAVNETPVREPETPVVEIVVRNISDRPVNLLEAVINERDKDFIFPRRIETADRVLEFDLNMEADFIRTLAPGDEFRVDEALELEGYGEFVVDVVFAGWRVEKITESVISSKADYELRATCGGVWGAA